MNILINGYFLSRPYTGFGDYAINLLKSLKKSDQEEFQFIVASPYEIDKKISSQFVSKNICLVIKKYPNILKGTIGKFFFEQVIIPKIARINHCQLIHSLYPSISILTFVKQIETIHDVIPWSMPEYRYSLLAKMFRYFIKLTSHKAFMVVTDSNWSKKGIVKHFKLNQNKIKVIYLGLGEDFENNTSLLKRNQILKKYQIEKPYIFYIGGFDARKKVGNMIVAFSKLKDKFKHNLIIAGGVFSHQRRIYADYYLLEKQLETLGIKYRVKRIGVVPYGDLPSLHSEAELFLSPSIEEGFNLPLLNAMAMKTPVIIHAGSASKEISGGAAFEVDCENVDLFSSSIEKLLKDKKLQRIIIEKQFERQKIFKWNKSAEQLLKLYAKILIKQSV